MQSRQLHLGAFMRPASIHPGAWRYPGAYPDANFNFQHMKHFAQKLEQGKFDVFFMADHLALLNMPIDALKRSATVTSFEPITLLSALASVTEHIGTDDVVIMKDPDTGWVNAATYRVMVHDKNTAGVWMSPGKHGRLIREKYFEKGEPCPVLVSCGQDPLLFLAGHSEVDQEISEFDYAGGHRGFPFETIYSELHSLPIPASSEIVLEGEIYGDELKTEGPFGEFMGYYASDASPQPIIKVRRVYYRNDPILMMANPSRPPSNFTFARSAVKSAMIWDEIEKAGLPGVAGIWCHEAGAGRLFNVISIKQMYPGHSKQAAMLAANCHSGNYAGRWVVAVDEDIDPSNIFDVIWALSTRCDPPEDVDFVRNSWSTPLDTMIREAPYQNNRGIIDACRPWGWKNEFPKVAEASPKLKGQVMAKWPHLFSN